MKNEQKVNQGVRCSKYSSGEMLTFYREFFNSIRATEVDGVCWFMLKDVANALGIKAHKLVLSYLDLDNVITADTTSYDGVCSTYPIADFENAIVNDQVQFPYILDKINRVQRPTWINEAGLNELIMNMRGRNRKIGEGPNAPTVKEVRNWILGTILPSIRRYSMYGIVDEKDAALLLQKYTKHRAIDSEGFIRLLPTPGGRYDTWLRNKIATQAALNNG